MLFFGSCAELAQRLGIVNCNYAFNDISPVQVGLTSMDLKLSIQVDNPNPAAVILDQLGFDFFVNENRIFQGLMEERMEIPSRGSSILDHIITLSYLDVGAAIVEAIKEKKASYRLTGKAYYNTPLGRLEFPVDIVKGKI